MVLDQRSILFTARKDSDGRKEDRTGGINGEMGDGQEATLGRIAERVGGGYCEVSQYADFFIYNAEKLEHTREATKT